MGLRHNVRWAASVASAMFVIASLGGTTALAEPQPRHPTSEVDWLSMVNFYRAQAGLAGLTEDHVMSDAAYKHAIYVAKNNVVGHEEDPSNPYYTPEGERAAATGNPNGWHRNDGSERALFARALLAPIHGLLLLQAHRTEIGYGFYREIPGEGGIQEGVTIGHWDPISTTLPAQYFPVMWPGDGQAVPYLRGGNEYPDLRPGCGFALDDEEWGLPVYFEFATKPGTPTATSFTRDGVALPHCLKRGPDWENFLYIIPRDPLSEGATYTASMTVDGETASTTFSVTPFLMTGCTLSVPAGQPTNIRFAALRDNSYMPGTYRAEDYPYARVVFGDGSSNEGFYSNGSEPNSFDISATHTYQSPGSYTFKVEVTDPYYTPREVQGTIQVTAAGTQPSIGPCSPPPLPPAPAFPSQRPTPTSDGEASSTPSPDSSTHSPSPSTPGPEGSPSDDPSEEELYERSVTLQLKRHLRAVGRVTVDAEVGACVVGRTVVIEKMRRRQWQFLKTAVTDSSGTYRVRLTDRPGRYRARLDEYELPDYSACSSARSPAARHVH